jgi:hypothetical protein
MEKKRIRDNITDFFEIFIFMRDQFLLNEVQYSLIRAMNKEISHFYVAN